MAKEKTTVKGLNKAIQSISDKFNLRLQTIEEKAEIKEKQRRCEHFWVAVNISPEGYTGRARCCNCRKVFYKEVETKRWYKKGLKKLHKYLITKS